MNSPKEKAKELVEKFLPFVDDIDLINYIPNEEWGLRNAKQCALIAVDELINDRLNSNILYPSFWIEVKQEIER